MSLTEAIDIALSAAPVAVAYSLLGLYAFFVVRRRQGAIRWVVFLLGFAWAAALPLLGPVDLPTVRFTAGLWAFVAVLRITDVAWDRYPAPEPRDSLWRFLVTWFVAPDTRWAVDDRERQEFRRAGLRRAARGVVLLAGAVGMLAISTRWPQIHDDVWRQGAWLLVTSALLMPGALALATGVAMLPGLWIDEMFDAPFLSRSPRDFWSRRWNRLFTNAARRHIFRPLLRQRNPALAMVIVFGASALLHEYLVVVSLGTTEGRMTAFFALHCVATLADYRFRRRPPLPRPIAIAMHFTWFWLGFPLFMLAILPAIPIHEVRLW